MLLHLFPLLFSAFAYLIALVDSGEYPAPVQFTEEPKDIQFAHTRSAYLYCKAKPTSSYANNDQIVVTWRYGNGSTVQNIANIIQVLPNGTLWFLPFMKLISGIHRDGQFQCVAKLHQQNRAILSRIATVTGIILQPFEVTVKDQYASRVGATVVFTCVYPEEVSHYVQLKRWWIDDKIADHEPSGHLVISDVQMGHVKSLYYCVVINTLTNQILASNVAKLFLPQTGFSNFPFKFSIAPQNRSTAVGKTTMLECLVTRTNVEYFWKHSNSDIKLNHHFSLVHGRSLRIRNSTLQDNGKYTCYARDKSTEETISATSYLFVQAPLTFRISPAKVCASYYSNVTLHCKVDGYPRPNITWHKDGQRITYSSKTMKVGNNLVFRPIWGKDEGIYQCIANNGIETIHRAASLIVGAQPPKIKNSFKSQILQEHEKLDISCEATGDREATVYWYRDDELIDIDSDNRIIVKHFHFWWTLQIKNTTAADSGVYKCEAKNRAGTNFSKAEILIKGPPKVIFIPRTVTGLLGGDVNITCKAKGYPAPTITWLDKNGKVLPQNPGQETKPGNGKNVLIIKGLNIRDKGHYTCQAANGLGVVDSAFVNLRVSKPLEEKDDYIVREEGSDHHFVCHQGSEWTKDDQVIKTNPRITIRTFPLGKEKYMSMLILTNITAKDAGNYICIKRSDLRIYKDSYELVVITRPRFLDNLQTNLSVLERGKVQILCPVSSFPTPRVEWKRKTSKGFQPIPKSLRFSVTLNGLTILNVTEEDETNYSCIAYSSHTNKEIRTIKLNVNVPAKIMYWLPTVSSNAGNTTTLACNATGDAIRNFIWLKNEKKIPSHVKREDKTSSSILIMERTTSEDAGSYTCKVVNAFGEDKRKMTLRVHDKPFPPVITKTHIATKISITIFWNVTFDGNSPIMSYQIAYKESSQAWSDGKVTWIASNQTSYEISSLRPYRSYNIKIRAKNIMGLSNASDEITAETQEDAPSAAPSKIEVASKENGFEIEWEPLNPEYSNGRIMGYVISYRKAVSQSDFMETTVNRIQRTAKTISYLKPFTEYKIMIRAFTKAGQGPNSSPIIKRTEEGVPNQPPTSINMTAISSTSIFVSWRPPPESERNGKLIGYQIFYKATVAGNRGSFLNITGNKTDVILQGLRKYTSYTVKVAARTRKGCGKGSIAFPVRTKEDIPGPPKGLTARTTSIHSIKLEWEKPDEPNGNIIAYTIHYVENEEVISNSRARKVVNGKENSHEFESMTANRTYYFWICAETNVGIGNCTNFVMASTSNGPPSILKSLESSDVTARWKTNVTLNCKFTGFPIPVVTWLGPQGKSVNVKNHNKYKKTSLGGLEIRNLQREDSKRYICQVKNKLGTDKKSISLKVQTPPSPPQNIKFSGVNTSAIKITWKRGFNGYSVITNYSLKYRHIDLEWKVFDLLPTTTEFIMNNIHTSKQYFFKMRASNEIGRGNYSEIKKMTFRAGDILQPDEEFELEDEVETRSSSKVLLKDTAVLGTLIGVSLFIIIVIVIVSLVILTKLGYNPGTKLIRRSVETWRWLASKGMSSEDRRKKHNRRSGGSSTDGHLGGSSSSLSQHASDNGSSFSLPRSSSRVTESGYSTNFFPIPLPFGNYTPGSNGCSRVSGSSDEGIGPETRGEQHHGRAEASEKEHSQSSLPPRSSNGTPAPLALIMSTRDDYNSQWMDQEQIGSSRTRVGANTKRSYTENIGKTDDEKVDHPTGKERIYLQALCHGAGLLPQNMNKPGVAVNLSPGRPKYEDGHFIIGPDIDRILAYRPPRCYDSTSSEYSSSRDELAQAYEFGKLHHLDDFYGRPTLESASSSGETASSERDGICHFTTELSAGRPFLIPVAIVPPPPNQRLRTRDRKRNTQGAALNTYYEKDETLV